MARNHSVLRRAPRLLPLLRQQQLLLLLSAAAALLWAPGAGLCLAALRAAAALALAGGRTAAGGGRPWQPSGGRSDCRASLVARRQQPEGFDGGLQGLGLQRLGYGKYKGRTYEDILRSDPEFCKKELLKADFPSASPSLRSFTAWLQALQGGAGTAELPPFGLQGHLPEADQQIEFGMYQGKSFQEVLDKDPEYCGWVLAQAEMDDVNPSLWLFADWLQEKEFTPPTVEAASQITFGKHRGKSFQEVLDQDPEYCAWVLAEAENEDAGDSLSRFADWLQDKEFTVPTVVAASQITFGKHRGESFQDVLDQDPEYCAWVLAQAEMEDATDSLRRFADWLQDKEFTASQITFGKHRGKSFQEVLDQDPEYCAWVLAEAEKEDARDSLLSFADWLQDKEFTVPSGNAASQITFGKHRGKSFQEVLDQDPDYCKWVLAESEKEDASDSLLSFADWLQDKEFTVPSGNAASQVTFGKHRGKSFQEILDEDPDYCEWILRRAEIGEASPSLLQFAGWLEAAGFTASAGQDSSLVAFDKRRGNAFQEVPVRDSLVVGQQQSGGLPGAGRGVVRFDR